MEENNVFQNQTEVNAGNGKKPGYKPALVFGILSIPVGLLIPIGGFILAIVGLILAVSKRKDFNTKAALICSIIGIVVALVNWIAGTLILLSQMSF